MGFGAGFLCPPVLVYLFYAQVLGNHIMHAFKRDRYSAVRHKGGRRYEMPVFLLLVNDVVAYPIVKVGGVATRRTDPGRRISINIRT